MIIGLIITLVAFVYATIYGLGYMVKGHAGGSQWVGWVNKKTVFPVVRGIGKGFAYLASNHPLVMGFIIIAIIVIIITITNEPRLR